MSDYYDQQSHTPEGEESPPQVTPGELLARKREAAGLSHATVGEALHLTVHYIKALESNEYGKLPGQTFVKGYIRSYARFLQMDIPAVLACYEAHLNSLGIAGNSEYGAGMRKRSDQTLLWAIAAGAVLIVALFAGWWFFGRGADDATNMTAVIPAGPRPVSPNASASEAVRTTTPAFSVNPVVATAGNAAGEGNAPGDDSAELPADIRDTAGLDELVAVVAASTESTDVEAGDSVPAAGINAQDSVDSMDAAESDPDLFADATATTTEAEVNDPEATEQTESGPRHVSLMGEGDDVAEFTLTGASWIEVTDAAGNKLFGDMLEGNDTLSIRGAAPFDVLLGDARNVSLLFNDTEVDLGDRRSDNSIRLILETSGSLL